MTNRDNTNQDSQMGSKILTNSSLPIELILEILVWLPVASLLKCRAVCKLWLSLISSSHFIKTHLLKAIETTPYDDIRLITNPRSGIPPFNKLRSCSVFSLYNEPHVKAAEVDCPMKDPCKSVWIVGSCNGLFCLATGRNVVFLWNPATRKSREVLIPDEIVGDKCYTPTYGFGYDECNDDYKVVANFWYSWREAKTMKVIIYSSRLDSWRSIEDIPSSILFSQFSYGPGNYANGALYWAANRDMILKHPDSLIIISFNFKTERYGEVSQPKYDGEGVSNLRLGVVEGSLCVICNYQNIQADVWLMNESCVDNLWTKFVSIPYVYGPESYGYSVPICISATGDILLKNEYGILVYNNKDCDFKDFVISKFIGCCAPYTYIESLVSPNV